GYLYTISSLQSLFIFFLHAPATPEIYTLSLHDALPICSSRQFWQRGSSPARELQSALRSRRRCRTVRLWLLRRRGRVQGTKSNRSEEHTSELQSRGHLVCRLLLEKKKNT